MERQRDRMGTVSLNTYLVRVNLAWVGWSQQIDPSPRPPPLDWAAAYIYDRWERWPVNVLVVWCRPIQDFLTEKSKVKTESFSFLCEEVLLAAMRKYFLCLSGRLASLYQEVILVFVRNYFQCLSSKLASLSRNYCLFMPGFSLWGSITSVRGNVLCSMYESPGRNSYFSRKSYSSLSGSLTISSFNFLTSLCQEALLPSGRQYFYLGGSLTSHWLQPWIEGGEYWKYLNWIDRSPFSPMLCFSVDSEALSGRMAGPISLQWPYCSCSIIYSYISKF